VTMVDVVS